MAQVTLKTAQDARQFLFWRFFGHVPTARLILPLKTAQDARQFLFCVFYGPLGSEVECVYCWRLVGLRGPFKFFAYVAPKGVMLFDSNVRFK